MAAIHNSKPGGREPAQSGKDGCDSPGNGLLRSYPQEQVIRHGASVVCSICKDQFFASLTAGERETAGHREFAPFWRRLTARIIDAVGIVVVLFLSLLLAGVVDIVRGQDQATSFISMSLKLAIFLGALFGYSIFFLGKWGRTPGRMLLRIKVVRADGAPLSYGRAAIRTILDTIFSLVLVWIVSVITVFVDEKRRALHDMAAGTIVVSV